MGKNWGRIKYKGQKLTNFKKKIVFGAKKQAGAKHKKYEYKGQKLTELGNKVRS